MRFALPRVWRLLLVFALLVIALLVIAVHSQAGPRIICDPEDPRLSFAATELEAALAQAGQQDVEVMLQIIDGSEEAPESFRIGRGQGNAIQVTGPDPAGVMYGSLDLAETIRIRGIKGVADKECSPAMGMRGIKFNIPLDVRTPSYSDMGDAGQHNIPHVWDESFWTEMIDELARHRYNYVSLWNLHPFPSLVQVPEYPEIALDDVKRAVGLEKKHYHGRGEDFDADEILDQTETLIEITIEEKIDFWRRVMAYGKARNIDFYFVTWNVFDYGTDGKYGITDELANPKTKDYFRQSVKALFLTYPDLKGIGITTGENMHGASNEEKEDWMLDSYGKGVLDVVNTQPGRKITFLHRQHQAGAEDIARTFQPLIDHPDIEFLFSFKYAKAHSYSATRQTFHGRFVDDLQDHGDLKTIWTMRNDSTYLFRWGAPDFLREFVRNIPQEVSRGYYFGSDGWIWGRDFVCKSGSNQGELEIRRHWLQWLLWGRFAYDTGLTNERIAGIIQTRFPEVDGKRLLEAWQAASMVFPTTTGFHWGALDYHWYPEACIGIKGSRKKGGFHDVESFIEMDPHPGTDFIDIETYVKGIKNGGRQEGRTPHSVSKRLLNHADQALSATAELNAGENRELAETLRDIEAMAQLSRYYGYKIEGAARLHLFREINRPEDQKLAIEALEKAAEVWREYTANLLERYQSPIWCSRIRSRPVDWNEITQWVDEDVTIARKVDHQK